MSIDNPYKPPESSSIQLSGRERLLRIAKAQRQVNFAALLYLLNTPVLMAINAIGNGTPWAPFLFGLIILFVFGFGAVSVYKLAAIYRGNLVAVVYALGLLVPVLGLLLLLTISGKATKELRAAGIKVGLLGANPNSF